MAIDPPTKTMWRVIQTRLLACAVASVLVGCVTTGVLYDGSLSYGTRLDDALTLAAGLALFGFLAARYRLYWTTISFALVAGLYAVAKIAVVASNAVKRSDATGTTRFRGSCAASVCCVLLAVLTIATARRGLIAQRAERELYLAQLGAQGVSLTTDYEALEEQSDDRERSEVSFKKKKKKQKKQGDDQDAGVEEDDDDDASTTTIKKKKKKISLRHLVGMLKPYFWPRSWTGRLAVLSTILSVTLSKVASIAAPLLLSTAANSISSEKTNVRRAIAYASGYAALTFGSKAFKECQSLAYLRVQKYAFVDLSTDAFSHLHSLSLHWSLSKKMGEVVRVTDRGIAGCDSLMRYGVLYVLPSIAECVAVCVIFAFHFHLWQLSILVFGAVLSYAILTVKLTLWRKRFRTTMNQSDNRWHDHLTESLVNFEAVKHATAERYELKRFERAITKYQTSSVRVQASLSLLNIAQQVILCSCLGGSLAIVANAVHRHEASVGGFVSVNVYVLNLFAPLNFLGTVYNTLVMAIVDLRNLSELLAEPPLVRDMKDAMTHPNLQYGSNEGLRVTFLDVRFAYPGAGSRPGLRSVSFNVDAGHSLGIVGPTGAGKSTIGRLLFRFYDVDAGAVLVGGVDVRKVTQHSLRRLLGVVPQDTVLFNESIAYNIAYADPDARQRLLLSSSSSSSSSSTSHSEASNESWGAKIVDAAKRAELWDFVQSLDLGLDTIVGERGLKLSGGEKQRVAIARLFVKNPPVVLLDEATSALDSRTERAIQASLKDLAKARTSIAIAHRLSTIFDADQILVLKDGCVVELGAHADLLALDGEYAAMWHAQGGGGGVSSSSSDPDLLLHRLAQEDSKLPDSSSEET